MITKPFDLELANKIRNGVREGEIVTIGHNYKVDLVYYNKDRGMFNTLGVIYSDSGIISDWFSDNGLGARGCRLCINIPEYTTFKDGDVLSNEEGDYLFILNTLRLIMPLGKKEIIYISTMELPIKIILRDTDLLLRMKGKSLLMLLKQAKSLKPKCI